jgi:hypothetical protein
VRAHRQHYADDDSDDRDRRQDRNCDPNLAPSMARRCRRHDLRSGDDSRWLADVVVQQT